MLYYLSSQPNSQFSHIIFSFHITYECVHCNLVNSRLYILRAIEIYCQFTVNNQQRLIFYSILSLYFLRLPVLSGHASILSIPYINKYIHSFCGVKVFFRSVLLSFFFFFNFFFLSIPQSLTLIFERKKKRFHNKVEKLSLVVYECNTPRAEIRLLRKMSTGYVEYPTQNWKKSRIFVPTSIFFICN